MSVCKDRNACRRMTSVFVLFTLFATTSGNIIYLLSFTFVHFKKISQFGVKGMTLPAEVSGKRLGENEKYSSIDSEWKINNYQNKIAEDDITTASA